MNTPLYYYPNMEMKYRIMLDEQKSIAAIAKEKLMAIDPILLNDFPNPNQDDDYKYGIVNKIREYYSKALFFHDEETLDKIKQLHLVTNASKFNDKTRWFVSLEEIHQQYQIIREHDIKVDSLQAYNIIKVHLASKFLREILMEYLPTTRDEIRMSQITKGLINLKSRRKYAASNPKSNNNPHEILINFAINEFAKLHDDKSGMDIKFDMDTFINLSKGKTESLCLRILVEECLSYNENKLSKTKFLGIIFDLMKLIMPDRNFMDEKTFDFTPDLSYKSYTSFKAQVLKKILYPKRIAKQVSSV